jgi:hypothetical protein
MAMELTYPGNFQVCKSIVKYRRINEVPAGLPDGLFSNQKSKFGYILDSLAMEDVIYYEDLV